MTYKHMALFIPLFTGCISNPTPVPKVLDPEVHVMSASSERVTAQAVAPPQKFWLLTWKYPTNFANYSWVLQRSTNLIHWTDVPGNPTNVLATNKHEFFRMRGIP